jgi:hypothetical protein
MPVSIIAITGRVLLSIRKTVLRTYLISSGMHNFRGDCAVYGQTNESEDHTPLFMSTRIVQRISKGDVTLSPSKATLLLGIALALSIYLDAGVAFGADSVEASGEAEDSHPSAAQSSRIISPQSTKSKKSFTTILTCDAFSRRCYRRNSKLT